MGDGANGGGVSGKRRRRGVCPKKREEEMKPSAAEERGGTFTEAEIAKFAEVYVETEDKVRAYRAIRPKSKMSFSSMEREVRRLVHRASFARAIEAVSLRGTMSKARLNAILSEEIESAARELRLTGVTKLIDILCRMNGYYEAQKLDVRHGAIDEESRGRALEALRSTGSEFVEAEVVGPGAAGAVEEAPPEVPLLA